MGVNTIDGIRFYQLVEQEPVPDNRCGIVFKIFGVYAVDYSQGA
jgi:hypothetical protein